MKIRTRLQANIQAGGGGEQELIQIITINFRNSKIPFKKSRDNCKITNN